VLFIITKTNQQQFHWFAANSSTQEKMCKRSTLSKQVNVTDFKLLLWILVLVKGKRSAAQCKKQPATALLRNFNLSKQLQNESTAESE